MIEVFISTNDTDYQEVFASYQQRVTSGGGTIDSLSCLSTGLLGLDARGFAANKLDLAPDFDIAITRSIADIRNPEQRSSDYTKTLTIPATKNNNQIFGHIFEVGNEITGTGQYTPDFDPNKKADCFVTADGIEQIRGFIRLTEIIVENNNLIGYNCTIHGETANLFTSTENAKLADLDFSEYNHELNVTNITDSWDTQIYIDGSPTAFEYGVGYVWSQMIPKDGSIHRWAVNEHTPCLYAKTIVDKIFSTYGYEYTDDSFFTTDEFKRLVVPYTYGAISDTPSGVTQRLFQAQVTGNTSLSVGQLLPAANDSTGGNFDNGGNYDTSTYKYTAAVSGGFRWYVQIELQSPAAARQNIEFGVYVYDGSNTVLAQVISVPFDVGDTIGVGNAYVSPIIVDDEVDVRYIQTLELNANYNWRASTADIDIATQSYFYNESGAFLLAYRNTVDFGQFFTGNWTQKEFLLNIVKMFNLYIEQTDTKTLRIETRDEFYNGDNVDWSKKLDYSQPHQLLPMGDLQNNPYKFTYKEGGDIINKQYKDVYSRIYGDRVVDIDNDFIKQEKKIEVTFSPSVMVQEQQTGRYYSSITKDDSSIRILYYGGKKSTVPYSLFNRTAPVTPNESYYPLTLHIDDVDSMSFDLNFGMVQKAYVPVGFAYSNDNLVNKYYYKYISEIGDKNSKIFKGYFRITPNDWGNISFADNYFFEGQYWKLNKITDYRPTRDGVYLCEFLLSTYYTPYISDNQKVGQGGFDGEGDATKDRFPPNGRGDSPVHTYKGGLTVGNNTGSDDTITHGENNQASAAFVTILGSEGTKVGDEMEYTTAINCTDFVVPESRRVYVENYPVVGAWLGSGKVVNIDDTDSPYSAVYDDWLIICDTTNGNVTVTLPTPTAANKGKMFLVKKTTASHNVTINAGDGSVLIDDQTSITDNTKNGFDEVVSDGTQYWIIGEG